MKLKTILGGLLLAVSSIPTLTAGADLTPAPALLAPPMFTWNASPWASTVEISRKLLDGSTFEYKVGSFKASKLCNGSGVSDAFGESFQSCSYTLSKTTDVSYSYILREFSADARFVRRTNCEPMGGVWVCTRIPL